ncbi:MAG: nicotinate-nucleotide--dimethylbenzimidazole phosphoribosyltransferase [Desulfobacterales bacterium]|nr:nicotinate-nucleotide--dimethylbenzimidazole phosphoribosyltransferase [Desulfobacterales bacterium]
MLLKDFGLEKIIHGIVPANKKWIEKAQDRTGRLIMPTRALGKLHDISERLCGIQETLKPSISKKAVLVMAGDHGVVAEGVSAYPQEVTGEMVRAFLKGGAGINVISRQVGADVWVVDMGIIPKLDPALLEGGQWLLVNKVGPGTANLAQGPAMKRQDAETAILTGFHLAAELFNKGVEILGTGDMGIGNTTPSAAIGTVVAGATIEEMVGRGTGIDDEGLQKKQTAIRRGIQVNMPDSDDGLDILSKIGGFEIGGIAGCILAGAYHHRPIVIDGLISTAGALVAHKICPTATDYIFAGHCSEEPGHRIMLNYLGLDPILNLGMRLGEGTGGALAMGIMEGAVRVFREMLTFDEANVSNKESA